MTARIKAPGRATYHGNCTHMVGEVKGPTTYGQMLVATDAVYDAVTDQTQVQFSVCTQDERFRRDEFGIVRVSSVGATAEAQR